MNCLTCRHDNPATVSYCQRCGAKLDLTADEISVSLFQKAKGEQAKTTAFYARQALFFSVVLFLIAMTLFMVSGGAPEEEVRTPSVSSGAKYLRLGYTIEKKLPMAEMSIPEKP